MLDSSFVLQISYPDLLCQLLRQEIWARDYSPFLDTSVAWNRPYSRCPTSLHALNDRRDKSDVTCFLRGQTTDKFFQYKKSGWSLFILDNRKRTSFYVKDNNGKLKVEDHFTCLDAVATADVLTASNNDLNFVQIQTVHFARLLNRRFFLRE